MSDHDGTSLCRRCENFVPRDRCVDGSYDDSDGTCVCPECATPGDVYNGP